MDFDFSNIINAISEFFSKLPDLLELLYNPIGLAASVITIITAIIAIVAWFVNHKSWLNDEMSKLSEISDDEKRRLIKSKVFVPTMGQYEPPHNGDNAIISKDRFSLLDMILDDLFSKASDKKRYIILGGSGMGKSTFLAAVFLKYILKRRIKKSPYPIYVKSLGNPDVIEQIRKINNEKLNQSILLLDALDENIDATKDLNAFMNKLESVSHEFRIVIITCRTQFYKDEENEPKVWGIPVSGASNDNRIIPYTKIYISPFTDNEVDTYLKEKYGSSPDDYARAKIIANKSIDIVSRPMILSFMDYLLDLNVNAETKTVEIYSKIIDKWLERERELFNIEKSELLSLSKRFAVLMYDRWQKFDQIYVIPLELKCLFDDVNIVPELFEGRSLLNRTSDGLIKFSHKSFWEFFLALNTFEKPGKVFYAKGLDMAKQFQKELYELSLNEIYLDCVNYFDCSCNDMKGFLDDEVINSFEAIKILNEKDIKNHGIIIDEQVMVSRIYKLWEILISKVQNEAALIIPFGEDKNSKKQKKPNKSKMRTRRIDEKKEPFSRLNVLYSTFMCFFEIDFHNERSNYVKARFNSLVMKLDQILLPNNKRIYFSPDSNLLIFPGLMNSSNIESLGRITTLHIGIGFCNYNQLIASLVELLKLKPLIILVIYIENYDYYELIDIFERSNSIPKGTLAIFRVFYNNTILDFFAQNRSEILTYLDNKKDNENRIKRIIENMYEAKNYQEANKT